MNFKSGSHASRLLSLVMASLVLSASPVMAAAEDFRIGVVDMQKALQTIEAGKSAKAQLEKEFNERKKTLQSEEASIRKLTEEFKKQSMVLSDEAKAKKQQELQERIMKYQEMTARSQQEIQGKEQQLTEPLIRKLKDLIGEIAKKKNYNVVLEKNENTVLYFEDKDEITGEVIKMFNDRNKG